MKELIMLAKTDEAAKLQVIESFEPLIKKTVRRCVKDFNLYPDAMQEGYLIVLKCIERYDPGTGATFSGYVKSALEHSLWSFMRKVKTTFSLDSSADSTEGLTLLDMLPSDTDIEHEQVHKLELKAMYDAIRRLPDKQREIIVSFFFHHRTMRSISKERDCHYNTIVNAKENALEMLRKSLADIIM